MATLARTLERRILKSAAVRIRMAILAVCESQALVVRARFPGFRTVTLDAAYVFVESREGESRTEMTKSLGRLPGILTVAAQTLSAKLAGVLILMATEALLAQAQIRLVEIFDFDFAVGSRRDMSGVVTLFARQLGVFSLKSESGGSPMIEFLTVQFSNGKLPSVVLHVTVSAVRLIGGRVINTGVIARVLFHASADLDMTVQTLQAASGEAEIMTAGTLRGAFQ